jgi:DmsE family decaheme c-type cytochrome
MASKKYHLEAAAGKAMERTYKQSSNGMSHELENQFIWMKAKLLFFALFFLFYLCAPLPLALGQTQQPAEPKSATSQSVPAANPSSTTGGAGFVGADTCKGCHEDKYKSWANTPHWKTALDTKGEASHQGCEGCHGPGADHVAGGGDKTKIFIFETASSKEIDARCLTCHAAAHPNFERSPHAHAKVSCTACHSAHASKSEASLLKVSQPQLCYSCHTDVKPAFAQPFHHKVDEGLMTCSDCHDSHGTFQGRMLKTTADQNAICTKCHAETAGPFVFEHPVIKAEGCTTCHSPHGSPNARLLNVSNANTLCLQCHSSTNLAAFPNAASEQGGPVHNQAAQYVPCTNCHSQIHGSNATYNFFR